MLFFSYVALCSILAFAGHSVSGASVYGGLNDDILGPASLIRERRQANKAACCPKKKEEDKCPPKEKCESKPKCDPCTAQYAKLYKIMMMANANGNNMGNQKNGQMPGGDGVKPGQKKPDGDKEPEPGDGKPDNGKPVDNKPDGQANPDQGGKNPPAPGGENPPAPGGENPPAPGGENPPAPGGENPPAPGGENPPAVEPAAPARLRNFGGPRNTKARVRNAAPACQQNPPVIFVHDLRQNPYPNAQSILDMIHAAERNTAPLLNYPAGRTIMNHHFQNNNNWNPPANNALLHHDDELPLMNSGDHGNHREPKLTNQALKQIENLLLRVQASI